MSWKVRYASNADELDISLFDAAASSCAVETAAEALRVSARCELDERSGPVTGSTMTDERRCVRHPQNHRVITDCVTVPDIHSPE